MINVTANNLYTHYFTLGITNNTKFKSQDQTCRGFTFY